MLCEEVPHAGAGLPQIVRECGHEDLVAGIATQHEGLGGIPSECTPWLAWAACRVCCTSVHPLGAKEVPVPSVKTPSESRRHEILKPHLSMEGAVLSSQGGKDIVHSAPGLYCPGPCEGTPDASLVPACLQGGGIGHG